MARRYRPTTFIITVALLLGAPAGAGSVAAQEESVLPASELEGLCRENAPNKKRRQACLDIVRTILAPEGSIVLPAIEPPTGPIEGATVGAIQATDHLVLQMAEFVWDADAGFSPDGGFRWVAGRFEVESKDPDAYVAVPNFTVTDESGFSYGFSTAVDPSLENGGLPAGQKRMGWVAFQVPQEAERLVIEYFPFVSDSQEPLVWTVENA
jgi:hypothetical protein